MFKSIFSRLFFTYAAILALLFASTAVSVGVFANRFVVNQHIKNVVGVADTIEYWTAAAEIEESDTRAKVAYMQLLKSWGEFLRSDIIITNADGEVLASTNSITTVPSSMLSAVIDGETVKKSSNFNGAYSTRVMTVGIPVHYQGGVVGAMFFNTGMLNLKRTTVELFSMLLLSSLLSMLLAAILVYVQSRRISKPIGEINRAAQNIASGKFDKRVAVTSPDEIGQLASSFNFMADSIESIERTRSEFISDVSHELRTPMTSISGFAQGMLDGTIPAQKRDEYLRIILDESKRLTKMVNDMLEMSKMSSSEYKLDITAFDLNELTRLCIIGLGSRIDEKNLDLNVDFENKKLMVLADKDAIQRVIINLLDNAIKFSYPNTTMSISVKKENGRALFAVGNFGDGINEGDLRNIFNRFYKTDKSRVNEKSGAGLGLSFVKNILTLHKQKVWVESVDTKEGSDAKYTTFSFTLELE